MKAARAGRNMASTINKVLARLNTMLHSAVEWNVISSMPRIKRLKEPKLEKPHYKQVDDEKFLAAARKADLKLYTVILLADDAGMRHGEIIALRKEDIRLDDGPCGAIVVTRSPYKGEVNAPKGNRCRRRPRTPLLLKAVIEFVPTVTCGMVAIDADIAAAIARTTPRTGIRCSRSEAPTEEDTATGAVDTAAASTSDRVTTPPGPEPATSPRSTPRDFANLRTGGVDSTGAAPAGTATGAAVAATRRRRCREVSRGP